MPTSQANVPETKLDTCPLCGAPLDDPLECNRCDWVKGYRHRDDAGVIAPRDVTAAVLSVIPGAGHIYKGHKLTGVLFMLGTLLVLFFVGAVGMVGMGFQLLLIPFYWVWVILEAYWVPDLSIEKAKRK